ncbi:MAG: hypothetical protein AXW12_09555 [Thalassospira sp. Nap_22]|nr:MAG: hypothetical protein AXW12_09555 [Thalassospira sp. Nap_22]
MNFFGVDVSFNSKQRIILRLGAAMVAFTMLFPPVIIQRSGNYFGRGFDLVFSLSDQVNSGLRIDTYVLTTLWIGILVVVGLLCLSCSDGKQGSEL